jgi:hypothetical protein
MANQTFAIANGAAVKLLDSLDGTHAQVLFGAISPAPAAGDKLIAVGSGTFKRLRDMGDGTHAEVIYGN